MIDADEIAPGLWQGARPDREAFRRFTLVVLCAREIQPSECPGTVLRVPLDDCDELTSSEWTLAQSTADRIASAVARGTRVLVTCHAGLNRSGLVTALTLRRLTGLSGAECVSIVRDRRHRALCNDYFARLVARLPARADPQTRERALRWFGR